MKCPLCGKKMKEESVLRYGLDWDTLEPTSDVLTQTFKCSFDQLRMIVTQAVEIERMLEDERE